MRRSSPILPTLLTVAAIALGPSRSRAVAPSGDLASYVLFAADGLRARALQVVTGNVGVNASGSTLRAGMLLDAPGSEVSADTARIPQTAACQRLIARDPGLAAPACPAEQGFAPVFADAAGMAAACGFPQPFPSCSADPATDIRLPFGETRVLEPGTYRNVKIRGGGPGQSVLVLKPGSYTFCSLRTGRGAAIEFEGPTTVNVTGRVHFGAFTVVNSGRVFGRDIDLYAAGTSVRFGRNVAADLQVCAPFAALRMAPEVGAFGRFVARLIATANVTVGFPTTTTTSTSTSSTTSTSTSSSTTTSTSTSSTTSSSTSSTTSTSSSTSTSTSSSTSTSTSTSSTTSTVQPRCGDGAVNQANEQCDDGNETDGDCCSASCQLEPDGQACQAPDTCGGDAFCESGACVAVTPAVERACLAPFDHAIVSNFDEGTVSLLPAGATAAAATLPVGAGAWGVAVDEARDEIWVTARESDQVTVIDATTRTVVATIPTGALPLGIVFDPAGERAYVASYGDNQLDVIDVATRTVAGTIKVGKGPSGLALDPTGQRLYVSNYAENTIGVVDLGRQAMVARIRTKKKPLELRLDPLRGRLYVTNFAADRISVIGTVSDSVLGTVRVQRSPFGIAVDPERRRVYVTNARSDTLSVVDADTCATTATVPVGAGPLGVGLDTTGGVAYVANSIDSTISLLDTTTLAVSATVPVGQTPVASGAFVAPLLDDCAHAPARCDDVNPMTLDSCSAALGCRFEWLAPPEAATTGLDELDTLVREAGEAALGGEARAVKLARQVTAVRTQLTEGVGTPAKRFKRAGRRLKRFAGSLKQGLRRGTMSCDTAQRLLDLARGVQVQLRQAARQG